jgi:hypothetical protein
MTDTTTHEAEATPAAMHTVARRQVVANGERFRLLTATYGLHKIEAQSPYFTVTGEGWISRPGPMRADDPDVGGAIHSTIAAAFPRLSDLIALHLSNVDGVPMHAEANGWYWYASADRDGDDPLHVPEQYRGLTGSQRAESYLHAPAGYFPPGLARTGFDALVDGLRLGWLAEAQAAIAAHNLIVPTEPS